MAYTNNWTGQQFNGSTGATDKPYVSANRTGGSVGGTNTASLIQSTSLLDQRDIYKQLVDLQDDAEWLDFMWLAGKKEATSMPTYYSFFNDKLYKPINIVTGYASATGGNLVLDAASYDFVVAGDLLRCANGVVRVTSKNGSNTITVASVTGSAFAVASATVASAFSNAQVEGSDRPQARRWLVGKLGNQTQIFRNALQITDVQNMSKVEIEINGKPYILPYEMIQGLQKHRGDISLAMWLGEASASTFAGQAVTDPQTYAYQTTRGMDSYISNYGITGNTATANVFTLADLTSIEAQLIANRAPFEYMIAGSNATVATISDFLKNLPSAGQTISTTSTNNTPTTANTSTANNGYYKSGINSGVLTVNGRQIDLEAEKFMHGGFTFNLKAFKVLSNQEVMNYTGSTVQASAYFLPMGKVKTVGGGMVDYFRYRYLPQPTPGQGSSETAEIMTGGLAPTPTNQEMNLTTTWTSNMGLEVFAPSKFAKIQVGNAVA